MERPETRPQGATSAGSAEPSPNLSFAEETRHRLVLYITRPEEVHNCHFWVGLYRQGALRATDLLSLPSIEDIYHCAATEGVRDQEPILVADTSNLPAKGFYLLPTHGRHQTDQAEIETMVQSIATALEAIKPQRVGLYFSPELMDKTSCGLLLKHCLLKLRDANTREFYLYAGAHGVNTVLNTALEVKMMLVDQEEVLVFH